MRSESEEGHERSGRIVSYRASLHLLLFRQQGTALGQSRCRQVFHPIHSGNHRNRTRIEGRRGLTRGKGFPFLCHWRGIVQRNKSSLSTRIVSCGLQVPIGNLCETIRVPGRSSRLSFGSSRAFMLADMYSVTTVGGDRPV